MSVKGKVKPLPKLSSDQEAEKFLQEADLTAFDLTSLKPYKFEFDAKSARINMRVPESMLEKIKIVAKRKQMPYTRLIRQFLESGLAREK